MIKYKGKDYRTWLAALAERDDEIERLIAHCEGLEAIQDIRVKECERLRAALERIADRCQSYEECQWVANNALVESEAL